MVFLPVVNFLDPLILAQEPILRQPVALSKPLFLCSFVCKFPHPHPRERVSELSLTSIMQAEIFRSREASCKNNCLVCNTCLQ